MPISVYIAYPCLVYIRLFHKKEIYAHHFLCPAPSSFSLLSGHTAMPKTSILVLRHSGGCGCPRLYIFRIQPTMCKYNKKIITGAFYVQKDDVYYTTSAFSHLSVLAFVGMRPTYMMSYREGRNGFRDFPPTD